MHSLSKPAVIPLVAALLSGGLLWPAKVRGDDAAPPDRDLFEIHVRPMLVAHCLECHGEAKQEGGLRLTSLEEMLAGGDSGPAIVPGKPQESLLLEAIRYESLEMPPDDPLEESQVDGIASWIAAGAPWPAGVAVGPMPTITDEDRQWWCYQPIADPAVPEVEDGGWCRNEIDRFVYARLAAAGLEPAPEAAPADLDRRVHFAITGLPPRASLPPREPALAAANQGRECFDAPYERLVDHLLASPGYGENQARYWLDLVRYADTDGYRADFLRPQAQQYRDYVIRSLNADKPYDRFVTEQLAGDEVAPGNRDALLATMYLRHWIYEHNQRDVEGQWHEILNDITETTADVFLAQGLKCARCHDHKFDPLLQKDFYRLQAFFAAFQPSEAQPLADVPTRVVYAEQWTAWEQATEAIRRRLYEIERPVLLEHSTREGAKKFVGEIFEMLTTPAADLGPYERQIASLAERQFDVQPEKLPEWLDAATEAERQKLLAQLREFEPLKPAPLPTLAFVASDVGPVAPPTRIPDDPRGAPIGPGFPTILDDQPAEIPPLPAVLQTTGRRAALARWITDPANPLTPRVIVNRVWQQHFGRGLVETSSDFGRLGQPPSHPELLDWLATRFIEDGWSLKRLHRRILTSATYRQTSLRPIDEQTARIDPHNALLWRMRSRRLSGEEITDAILAASGELEREGRAIYKPVKRNEPDPLLALFDFPDRIRSTGTRHRTTTPTQALLLMNHAWSHGRAAAMVERLDSEPDAELIRSAYLALFARPPDAEEQVLGERFLDSHRATSGADTETAGREARVALIHALLNANELLYVD